MTTAQKTPQPSPSGGQRGAERSRAEYWREAGRHRPRLWWLGLFWAAYVVAGALGQKLSIVPGVGISFWPPAGILAATLLLNAKPSAPWWLLAAGAAEMTCNVFWFGNPLPLALVYFMGNALEALTAAWLILGFCGGVFRLESVKEVGALAVFGGGLAPVVGATVIGVTDALIGKHAFLTAWPLVWLGDGTGLVVSTPLTFVAVQTWRARSRMPRARLWEAIGTFAALLIAAALAFGGHLPTPYITLPPLLWAAARFQVRGAATGVGVLMVVTAAFTFQGMQPFTGGEIAPRDGSVMLQLFLGISAVSALLVAALSRQHQQALLSLRGVNSELERRIAERTATLQTSEERLRALGDNLPAAALYQYRREPDGAAQFIYVSAGIARLNGVRPEEVLRDAMVLHGQMPPEHRRVLAEAEARSAEEGEDFEVEVPMRRADGEVRWMRMKARPRRDLAGGIVWDGVQTDVTEQRNREEALRGLSDRLALAQKASGSGIWDWHSIQPDRLFVSPEYRELFGFSAEEVIMPERWLSRIHPDDRVGVERRLRELFGGVRNDYDVEYRYQHPERGERWIAAIGRLQRNDAGVPHRFAGISIDCTTRKRAEVELERSRNRVEVLSRSVSTLLTAADPRTVIESLCNEVRSFLECAVFFNHVLDPMTGRLRLNACGGIDPGLARRIEPLTLDGTLCGTAARDGCRVLAEKLGESSDERSAFVRGLGIRAYACHPLLGQDNRPFGTLSFGASNRDQFAPEDLDLMKAVADHVAVALLRGRAEHALRESEERFRIMADGTPAMIWVTDAEARIRFVNRSYSEFFGIKPNETAARDWKVLIHPEDRAGYVRALAAALERRQSFRATARVRRHDGAWRWIHSFGEPLVTKSGEFLGMAGCSPDITQQKEFQSELERLVSERTEKLQDLVGELEHFSYSITHDMRAPLRSMRGFAEIISEKLGVSPDPELAMCIKQIITSAERMDLLITDALSYSRAVREDLPLTRVSVEQLLQGMLETYPEFIEYRRCIEVAGELPPVLGNQAGLTQCLSNLIGNALKFVTPGQEPRVRIFAEPVKEAAGPHETNRWVRICVEDSGIGIHESILPRVFNMFTRGQAGYPGTGIGLALVRKVVQRMGGRVGVESRLGKGSRFWMELRLEEARREALWGHGVGAGADLSALSVGQGG